MINVIRKWFGTDNGRLQDAHAVSSATPVAEQADPAMEQLPEEVVHVCIVSGERMGNVIPVLHEERRTHVVLMYTEDMAARAAQLKRFFEARGVACTLRSFDAVDQASIFEAMRDLRLWLNRHAAASAWCVNVTGGTTPMKLALFDALRDASNANASFIYSDTRNEHIDNLTTRSREQYRDVLNVSDYLAAQGLREMASVSGHPNWQRILKDVGPAAAAMRSIALGPREWILGAINSAANPLLQKGKGPLKAASDRDRLRLVMGDQANDEKLAAYERERFPVIANDLKKSEEIDRLIDADVLRVINDKLWFPNYRAAYLLGGFWLEWFTAQAAIETGFTTDHFRHGLEFGWSDGSGDDRNSRNAVRNELDLCVVHRNRMLVVECKTRSSGKLTDSVYKLDTLRRRVGSALSNALLVSASPLTPDEYRRVLETGGIYFCAGPDLNRIGEFLSLWKEGRPEAWVPSDASFKPKTGQGSNNVSRKRGGGRS